MRPGIAELEKRRPIRQAAAHISENVKGHVSEVRAQRARAVVRNTAEGIIKSARTEKGVKRGIFGAFNDDHGAVRPRRDGAARIRLYSKVKLTDQHGFANSR